ncbi:MAG: ActS/PrrB/RegB family redox-sensitive histidine kinase [Alphaproteobacteria bacterium]|nr:ActS/PrrB/RegB family redox-sensitive histidine kinase [Alphaproteobacteria bacterium]
MTIAPAPNDTGRAILPRTVGVRTLTAIRWVALAGQMATLLVVAFALDYPVPLGLALAIVGVSAALNLILQLNRSGGDRLSERQASFYLGFDILQLSALLFVTGGLENPFALLLLAPVTVSATILSRRSTIHLCVLALGCTTGLAAYHLPLPWGPEQFRLPWLYVVGLWIALVVALIFIAAYAWWVADESRRISAALAATQSALAREQRLAALGGLAAAAAHELGSPLSTIAVVARELVRELPADGDLADDARLLLSETQRCRDILASLARRSDPEADLPFRSVPLTALVEEAAAPHHRDGVDVIIEIQDTDDRSPDDPNATPPDVPRTPEVLHGLGALIQNAVQFARKTVEIGVAWTGPQLTVTIEDDGPGFSSTVLGRLGEPYVSSRAGTNGHMGLGVFIATTLLGRSGAVVRFANRPDGGGHVDIIWPKGLDRTGPGDM